jgi:hypothetical protein
MQARDRRLELDQEGTQTATEERLKPGDDLVSGGGCLGSLNCSQAQFRAAEPKTRAAAERQRFSGKQSFQRAVG